MPPTINHRVSEKSAVAMLTVMRNIESAFCYFGRLASTVVEKSDPRTRTKWISELEIGTVGKIFAVPRKDEGGKSLEELEQQLEADCVELMATKMTQLMHIKDGKTFHRIPFEFPSGNSLLRKVMKKYEDPGFTERALNPDKESNTSTVVELVPKVITYLELLQVDIVTRDSA